MTIPDRRPADLSLPCEHPFIGCPCRQPGDAQGPAIGQGSFLFGFKEIADRHPDLVGTPLRDERGPWLNCSTQNTTRGLLIWGDFVGIGDQKGFIANDLTLWVWTGARLEQR